MLPLRLILDGPADGAWNMAVDEALLLSAAAGGPPTLRFYRWSEPTLSLGYFQTHRQRQCHAGSLDCPLVRRASGGGAIVHDRELTYSFTTRFAGPFKRDQTQLYQLVHDTLIEALQELAPLESPVRFGTLKPDAPSRREPDLVGLAAPAASGRSEEPFLCFQRRSDEDVVLGDSKVAGSAQRRHGGAVVQHGSVLLERSECAPELPGWNDLASVPLGFDQLQRSWLGRLEEAFGRLLADGDRPEIVLFEVGKLSNQELADAEQAVRDKYRHPHWTERK
ncbi:MAG: biotin/lipoate A/B protein ligase family protein [Pirellulales bacterium]